MSVNKAKTPTKDGKYWFFRVVYKDEFNTPKRYNSKKYFTRAEAKEAELEFLNKLKENVNIPTKMTFKDLWNAFLEYQDDKVRISTKVGYKYRGKYLVPLYKIKCVDFNIAYYEKWITKEQLLETANTYGKSPYGAHLKLVAEDKIMF